MSVYVELKVVCTLPNSDIANNLEWPKITQITLFYIFRIAFYVSVTGEDKNFKFGTDVLAYK